MSRLSLCAVSLLALAAAGCTAQQAGGGGGAPSVPASAPTAGEAAPAGPVAMGRVTGPCTAARQGTLTVARNQVATSGSLQVRFNGRDPSFRTVPYVYMFQTNAQLVAASGAPITSEVFGLWQGQSQAMQICGQQVRVSLVRISDASATISIR